MNRFLLSLLIVLALSGCRHQLDKDDDCGLIVKIDCTTTEQGDVNDFFDDWNYIILDTNNELESGLISSIRSIAIDDSIIAINCWNSPEILVYKRNGELLTTFNRHGQGPKDYLNVARLQLRQGLICVLDDMSNKICAYDKTGAFIVSLKLPYSFSDFRWNNNGKIVLDASSCGGSSYNLTVYDPIHEKVVSEFLPFKPGSGICLSGKDSQIIGQHSGQTLYAEMFNPKVYKLDTEQNALQPIITYDFKTKMSLSDEEKEMPPVELYQYTANKPYFRWLGPLHLTDSVAYQTFDMFSDTAGNITYIYKFDTTTGAGELLTVGDQRFDDYPFLCSMPILIQDGWYVSALSPYSINFIENRIGKEIVSDKHAKSEDSNPILVFHHFR